ncbi:obscurin-like [Gambusia affinis]|uniref:obscurin-like n=1 Tax=Gambusia affinis TaxID=33528 RepID=UPI001CDB857F|nr:obscurin-like [Gambusia affinis]
MGRTLLCVPGVVLLGVLLCRGNPTAKTKPVLTVSTLWLSPGASVTLSCEVKPSSAAWTFYWYKALPDVSLEKYRYELVPGSGEGTKNDYYQINGQEHTAGYACRAGRGSPELLTQYSEPKLVWSGVSHPAASLALSPMRTKHYTVDEIQLTCSGKSTLWKVRRYRQYYPSDVSDCSAWGKMTGSTCNFSSRWYQKAVYWCESGTGEFSNAVNVTIHPPRAVLTVSPSWLSPKASVTLTCQVEPPSTLWRFYWYRAVPDQSKYSYRYDPLRGANKGTTKNSYVTQGQKHTAGYACRAGRGNPEIFTDYSKITLSWSAESHPAASLTVRPPRDKLFTGDEIQLKCSGSPGTWRVRRFRQSPYNSDVSDCVSWGTMSESSCTFRSRWEQTAVYWCESGSGQLSNALNVTVHATPKAVLTASTQWASPGASVILSCEVKPSSPGWRLYWYKAVPEQPNTYKYYPLPEKAHETLQHYVVRDQKHTSGYACRAGWGFPEFFTNYSESKIVWSAESHPAAALTVSPARDTLYTVDELQLTCTGSSGDWRVRRFRPYYQSDVSDCSVWGMMTDSSCIFNSPQYHKGVYWCESASGVLSNAVNITIQATPKPVLTVSTSWLSPGGSVTLRCDIKPASTKWRFYWNKAVPDLAENKYRYELLSDTVGGTVQGSHVVHGETHTAVYACRAGREKGQFFTEYSEPKFVWSAESHPAASLTVSPAREKLYIVDDIQLKCAGNSADWRVRRFRQSYYKSDLSDCSSWGTMNGPLCTFSNPFYRKAVYWCESGAGEFSNAVNITVEPAPQPLLTASPPWLSPGVSVTLTCEVKPSSVGWRFYWYKTVPHLSESSYKYDPLPDVTTGTVENAYIVYGQKHTAGYACRGGKGNPELFTDYSEPKIVWSTASNPQASLTVSPKRKKLFVKEKIQLMCTGGSADWRVNRFRQSYYQSESSNCTVWGKMTGSSCTFISPENDESVYWCESGSGEFSNAVNITLKPAPRPQLTVSPSWRRPGASVTLSCEVEPPSAEWRFYWYKAVPDLSKGYTYDLLPGSTKGTVQDSFVVHGQEHTAGYACRAGIGNPEIFTDYSEPKIVWSAESRSAASLTVSPTRDKFYIVDNIQLQCAGSSSDWRVRRFSYSYDQSDSSNCSSWGTMTGSSCTFISPRYHRAVYWCESGSGEYSNAVNITVNISPKPTLFVFPSWPSPGASVTLRCQVEPPSAEWRFYWYKAVPDLSQNNYTHEPLPGVTVGTVENVYIVHGQKHTTGFSCRAGKQNPEYFTGYSDPRFVWTAESHPAASLTVSPARDKLYIVDDIQLKCAGSSSDWRVWRFRQSYYKSDLSVCSGWGTMTGSSCTFNNLQYNVALYWCESGAGEYSNAVNITMHLVQKPRLTVSPPWLSPGVAVTLHCEVEPQSTRRRFYWYKAVPDLSQIKFRYDLLPDSVDGTIDNSFVIHKQKHTAGYACIAGWENVEYSTNFSEPQFVWSADAHPAASLAVSPVRAKLFTFDEVHLSCTGDSADWRVRRFSESSYSDCSVWGVMTGSLCTFSSRWLHNAVYWCESGSGEFSNALNITIHLAPILQLTASPSWLSHGASVNLSCEVDPPSDGWRYYWYRAVPDLSRNDYRYELLPDSVNGTGQDSLVIHGQRHTVGYACRVGYGNPEFLSRHSEPKFVCSPVSSPAASLSVSPDRAQHFTNESVTLNCGGNSAEWRVMMMRELSSSLHSDSCSTWGSMNGSSCTFSSQQFYKAAFWCESESGELSNAVNLTVQDEDLLLVSPVHPVTEGASVTLSCITREQNQLSNVIFYHNNELRQNDSRGELKISAVSQSDEGFYKCEHSGDVSPQSWVAIEAVLKKSSSSFSVMWAVGTVCVIVFIVLLLLLIRFIRLKGTSYFYDLVRPTKEPANDPKKGQSNSYSLLKFKNTGNLRRYPERDDNCDLRAGAAGRSSPAASNTAVYSEVRSTSGH